LEVKGDSALAEYLRKTTGLKVDHDGNNRVSIKINEKHDALVVVEGLDRSGMNWGDLRTRQDTLEDIFVRLVGVVIDEAGTIKEVKR